MAKLKIITFTALLVAIVGCTTATRHDDFKRVTEVDGAKITEQLDKEKYQKVIVLDRPPQSVEEIVVSTDPTWYEENTKIIAKNMPLSIVLKDVVSQNVKLEYGFAVDPNKAISATFEGTKKEALNILALTSNYGFTATEDKIMVDKFTTKTYVLPTTAGDNSFQLGSDGSSGSSASASEALGGEISKTGGSDGQYASTAVDKYNLTDQIYKGINKILNGEANITTGDSDRGQLTTSTAEQETLGYAEKIEAVSSIVVRTSPAMMLLIDDYVQGMVDVLSQSVELEIAVIEYQADDGTEFGIDAQLKRAAGSGNISLGVKTPSFSDALQGVGLVYTATKGAWDGTTAMINALRVTGKVSVRTSQKVKASNHMVQEIDLSAIQSYIATTTTKYEGADSDIPTTSIETAEVRDGVKMLAIPSIQRDKVYLKLNGVLSKLLKWDDQEINGVTIRSPRTRQSRFNISGAYEYNNTIIVTHMRQETNESVQNSYLDVPTGNAGSNKVIDTLVLLTPRKITYNK
ncbi:hypothetical protein [Vibrio sp. 1180_3]|uniref:hypothetical protein n=1 Tax=Vibrio sp. 1180_3 TaxID=2528832 RepID=UPI0024053C62|nr:hypothetical protein [Vibrio sp. 1180_3]MDF9399142.1 hypothetical protein [Vibrio sp. 1180_3]